MRIVHKDGPFLTPPLHDGYIVRLKDDKIMVRQPLRLLFESILIPRTRRQTRWENKKESQSRSMISWALVFTLFFFFLAFGFFELLYLST